MAIDLSEFRDASGWLLLAAGDNVQRAGVDYNDEPNSNYVWDSTVPHHAKLSLGDLVAIWDKDWLLGVSLIESITTTDQVKTIFRCPECSKAGFKPRKKETPKYHCFECGTKFETPQTEEKQVTAYRSSHEMSWVDLPAVLSGSELRSLCEKPQSQLSMRPLRTGDFLEALISRVPPPSLGPLVTGHALVQFPEHISIKNADGYTPAIVRVRRGQASFRASLIKKYGNCCAILGEQPIETLEACHLYSYAEFGQHLDHGGLLLRRDIHRLFDLGRLAIEPDRETVHLDAGLLQFPQYKAIDGTKLSVPLSEGQRNWVRLHWERHQPAGSVP